MTQKRRKKGSKKEQDLGERRATPTKGKLESCFEDTAQNTLRNKKRKQDKARREAISKGNMEMFRHTSLRRKRKGEIDKEVHTYEGKR